MHFAKSYLTFFGGWWGIWLMWALIEHVLNRTIEFDIHMSVHRNTIPNYIQQDATFLDLFISKDAPHVLRGFFAHHQEHITIHTALGIVNQLLPWKRWKYVPSLPR
jgi:hypothetical protein